jgi:hypothetical protein
LIGTSCKHDVTVFASKRQKGGIAEVGTYRGGSARLIGEYSNRKTIHAFDTLKACRKLARTTIGSAAMIMPAASTPVHEYLKGLPVELHKGVFPDSAPFSLSSLLVRSPGCRSVPKYLGLSEIKGE